MSWHDVETIPFSTLVGKTLEKVTGLCKEGEEVYFWCTDGDLFKMYHNQGCCESVVIDDIEFSGNEDLSGAIVYEAEELSSQEGDSPEDDYNSHTWTFYKLRTSVGYVTIKWHGSSNGYYSESVDFVKVGEQS